MVRIGCEREGAWLALAVKGRGAWLELAVKVGGGVVSIGCEERGRG